MSLELDQLNALLERFVVCFESIAQSFAGLNESTHRIADRIAPPQRPYREAVKTTIPDDIDKIKEAHGASNVPIDEWLSSVSDEPLGRYEREFIKRNASPKVPGEANQDRGGAGAAQGGSKAVEDGTAPDTNDQERG